MSEPWPSGVLTHAIILHPAITNHETVDNKTKARCLVSEPWPPGVLTHAIILHPAITNHETVDNKTKARCFLLAVDSTVRSLVHLQP